MRFRTKPKHMIDLIFPVSLLFVFALCSLTILLLAARIYQSTTENSALNHASRIGLSYIREKIRQNDSGSIHIGTFNGTDALILGQDYQNSSYYTYIYCYDGALRELFVKDGTQADLSAGTKILYMQHFSMEMYDKNLFRFECTVKDGDTEFIFVSPRSS